MDEERGTTKTQTALGHLASPSIGLTPSCGLRAVIKLLQRFEDS
jgi:hypothetical protein